MVTHATTVLEQDSLAQTLDHLNEAWIEGGLPDPIERSNVARWLAKRRGMPHSYAETFGLCEKDREHGIHLYTGELITSGASKAHILAEEAGRALMLLEVGEKRVQIAIREARDNLLERINMSQRPGYYCCGRCTVAMWRHLAAGGLDRQEERLRDGLAVLRDRRLDDLTWRSFPFYYTILALLEMNLPEAREELHWVAPRCEKILDGHQLRGTYESRRRRLLERVLLIAETVS